MTESPPPAGIAAEDLVRRLVLEGRRGAALHARLSELLGDITREHASRVIRQALDPCRALATAFLEARPRLLAEWRIEPPLLTPWAAEAVAPAATRPILAARRLARARREAAAAFPA